MKPISGQSKRTAAFTIIELLTVMSIIIILIGILVPGLNMAKRYAKQVLQRSQFHSIDTALEQFSAEYEGYPDSVADGSNGQPYCGAMKLCEAMVGQDLKGFNPDSVFRSDCRDSLGTTDLYPAKNLPTPQDYALNIKSRHEPYLQLGNANAYNLDSIYAPANIQFFNQITSINSYPFVLCDVYSRVQNINPTGIGKNKIGMPILYYKADISKTGNNIATPADTTNIYNYLDNDQLVQLGMPWDTTKHHPIDSRDSAPPTNPLNPRTAAGANLFYAEISDNKIPTGDRPFRADSYILMSAGYDGEYGTPDDIFNF